jgi:hypothetical protein
MKLTMIKYDVLISKPLLQTDLLVGSEVNLLELAKDGSND